MNAYTDVIQQLRQPGVTRPVRRSRPYAWFYGAPFLAGVLLLAGIWYQPWVPVAELLRDPLSVAELSRDCCHLHYGAVSNLGVLIWTCAAAVCLFAALLLFHLVHWSPETRFMLCGGFLTGFLVVDDLYLLHDIALPHFGVPQWTVAAAYVAAALTYLVCFRRQILEHDTAIFLAAGGLLAASVGIDQFVHSEAPWRIFLEDGAKLLGIILWSAFHIRTALTICYGTPRFARFGLSADRAAVLTRAGSRS